MKCELCGNPEAIPWNSPDEFKWVGCFPCARKLDDFYLAIPENRDRVGVEAILKHANNLAYGGVDINGVGLETGRLYDLNRLLYAKVKTWFEGQQRLRDAEQQTRIDAFEKTRKARVVE